MMIRHLSTIPSFTLTPMETLRHTFLNLMKEITKLSQVTAQPVQIGKQQEIACFSMAMPYPHHNEEINYRQIEPHTPNFSKEQKINLFKFYITVHELLKHLGKLIPYETDVATLEKYQSLRSSFNVSSVLTLLGWCYQCGIGTNQSSRKAENYYEMASSASTIARHNLALMRLQNPLRKFYSKVEQISVLKQQYDHLGKEISTSAVAVSYPLQLEDRKMSEKMLWHAANAGNVLAQYYLGQYTIKRNSLSAKDHPAIHLLNKAAAANYDKAEIALGQLCLSSPEYKDVKKAYDCFIQAAHQNEFEGILLFANFLAKIENPASAIADLMQMANLLKMVMEKEKMSQWNWHLSQQLIKLNRPSFWQDAQKEIYKQYAKVTTVNMLVALGCFTEDELEKLFKRCIDPHCKDTGIELIDRIYPKFIELYPDKAKEYERKIAQCYEEIVSVVESDIKRDSFNIYETDMDRMHRYIPYLKKTKILNCNHYNGKNNSEIPVVSKEVAQESFRALAKMSHGIDTLEMCMPTSDPWEEDCPMTLFELLLKSDTKQLTYIPPFMRERLMSFTLDSFLMLAPHATFLYDWLKEGKNNNLTNLSLCNVRFHDSKTAIKTLDAIFAYDYLQSLEFCNTFIPKVMKRFLKSRPSARIKSPIKRLKYSGFFDGNTSTVNSEFLGRLQSPVLDTLEIFNNDYDDDEDGLSKTDRKNLFKTLAKQNTLTRLNVKAYSCVEFLQSSLQLSKLERMQVDSYLSEEIILCLPFLLHSCPALHTLDLLIKDEEVRNNHDAISYTQFLFIIENFIQQIKQFKKLKIYFLNMRGIPDDTENDCNRLKNICKSKIDEVNIHVSAFDGRKMHCYLTPNITLKNHWCQVIALVRLMKANLDSPLVTSVFPLLENIALLAGNEEAKPFAADRFMETRFFRNIINRARLIQAPLESANSSSSRSGIKRKQVL